MTRDKFIKKYLHSEEDNFRRDYAKDFERDLNATVNQESVDFTVWYSGMSRDKVLAAHDRYKREKVALLKLE